MQGTIPWHTVAENNVLIRSSNTREAIVIHFSDGTIRQNIVIAKDFIPNTLILIRAFDQFLLMSHHLAYADPENAPGELVCMALNFLLIYDENRSAVPFLFFQNGTFPSATIYRRRKYRF